MTYVSGFVTPVPEENREAYLDSARTAWPLFRDYGALEIMEAWSDHVPEGKQTDFRRAVDLQPGEIVCFSWILWPDKETHDRCGASMDSDPRWQAMTMPFDARRMIWGGFSPIFHRTAAGEDA